MARKEINIFNVSFLDLLSGALGAVIILYIIVPKIDISIEEFEEQKKLSQEIKQLGKTLEQLKNAIPKEVVDSLDAQMQRIIEAKEELEAKIEDLQHELKKCQESQRKNQEDIVSLQEQVDRLKEGNQESQDVGFKFGASKRIVFLLDISGSMGNDNKLGEVKAGLKMLVATMDPDFYVDVVIFPRPGGNDGYASLWSSVKPMNQSNKTRLFQYLNTLAADGGTPVRETLLNALKNYTNLSDLVLLCDGEPSDGDPDDILNDVKAKNTNNVKVNTIGVGREYSTNPSSPKVAFLRHLASQNNGFFIAF